MRVIKFKNFKYDLFTLILDMCVCNNIKKQKIRYTIYLN